MKNQIYFFLALLIGGLMILWARAFQLQIILGQEKREIAEGNRIKKLILQAPRGIIFDRLDRPLVKNIPIYYKCPNFPGEINGKNEKCQKITREEALKIEAETGGGKESLRVEIGREYIYGKALAHLLGYLGEANEEEVKNGKYQVGDLVGRGGVEQEYDQWLRGKNGGEVFEINALGEKIRQIGIEQPISGNNLKLTIDGELSKVAFEALAGRKGAVVASRPDGEILVLVSSPSFDPEKITPEILTDSSWPMFNRAIAGLYPPGSTFKIITAVAGLEEGKITSETFYDDPGEIRVGDYVYRNWYFTQYGKREGKINIIWALKRSTDTFFYKVGEWVGPIKLREWAISFGLGKPTGIDLPGEAGGKLPNPKEEEWFLGNTYHFAIGQGGLLTTPLQINMMTTVIANNGEFCEPKIRSEKNKNCYSLPLKKRTLQLIKEGLKEVCLPGGTAFPFFNFTPSVAGKTGTAEFNDPAGRTHAWFTGFAPVENPQIVVTAMVEGGGEGSYVAAPIVKKVMEKWFEKK